MQSNNLPLFLNCAHNCHPTWSWLKSWTTSELSLVRSLIRQGAWRCQSWHSLGCATVHLGQTSCLGSNVLHSKFILFWEKWTNTHIKISPAQIFAFFGVIIGPYRPLSCSYFCTFCAFQYHSDTENSGGQTFSWDLLHTCVYSPCNFAWWKSMVGSNTLNKWHNLELRNTWNADTYGLLKLRDKARNARKTFIAPTSKPPK